MALIMKYIDRMHHYMDTYGGEYLNFEQMTKVTKIPSCSANDLCEGIQCKQLLIGRNITKFYLILEK